MYSGTVVILVEYKLFYNVYQNVKLMLALEEKSGDDQSNWNSSTWNLDQTKVLD